MESKKRGRRDREKEDDSDAVSPVIGVVILVAITVILATVIGTLVLGFGSGVGETPQAGVSIDQDPGESITVRVLDTGNIDALSVQFPEGLNSDVTMLTRDCGSSGSAGQNTGAGGGTGTGGGNGGQNNSNVTPCQNDGFANENVWESIPEEHKLRVEGEDLRPGLSLTIDKELIDASAANGVPKQTANIIGEVDGEETVFRRFEIEETIGK